MKDHKKFAEMMYGLGIIFDREISKQLIDLYWSALENYTDEEITIAFSKATKTLSFFPKPAELIQMIEGSTEGRAAEAYTKLKQACGQVGAYNSVEFDDPAITSVVLSWGGWVNICQATEDEWRFNYTQKQFKNLYERACMRPESPKALSGIVEATNGQKGFKEHIPKPVRVGTDGRLQIEDENKQKLLYEQEDSAEELSNRAKHNFWLKHRSGI